MSDPSTLRSELATLVEDTLTNVDSDYSGQVVEYYRPVVDRMASRRELLNVMGVSGTVKFAEILHVQDDPDLRAGESSYRLADGGLIQTPQVFSVSVWRELVDADTLAGSSVGDWNALIWDEPNGLMPTFRSGPTKHTMTGGEQMVWNQPEPADDQRIPLTTGSDPIISHYATFLIRLTAD